MDGDKSNALDDVVFGFGGDIIGAFMFCEKLAGLTIKIPAKSHRTHFAFEMLKSGIEMRQVVQVTGISRATKYRLMKRLANGEEGL